MPNTVEPTVGLRTDLAVASTDVVEYQLPVWTEYVDVSATDSGGADLEVSWTGSDGDPSFTGEAYAVVKAGSARTLRRPPHVRLSDVSIFVRCKAATATDITIQCSRGEA
jgi:hypothetical protein